MNRPPRRSRPAQPGRTARAESPFAFDAVATAAPAWAVPAAWAVLAVFAAALVGMIAGPHVVGDVFTESDFYGAYALGARALEHGHLDPSRYGVVGPVYEMLLALVGLVVRDLFVAAELLALVSMTATLWCWHRIVRAQAGPLAALVGTLLLATNAHVFRYGYAVTTDAPALALQSAALALLLAGPVRGRRGVAAGLVAGLAFLTRYNAVVLLPAGLVALLAGWTDTPAAERRGAALRFAAGFLAPVVPWIAVSLASGVHAHFVLHHNVAYEVFARSRGITWDEYERSMQSQFPTPWSVFARDPAAVTAHLLANVGEHLRLDAQRVAGWPLAIAAAAGLVLGPRGGGLGRLKAAWLALGLAFLALVPAFHSERYSLAVLPAWTTLAALGLASPRLALVVRAGGRRVWLKPALALLVAALALRASVAFQRGALSQLPVEVRTVARAAAPFVRPGDRVFARKPHFAWQAGMEAAPFPFADSLSQLAAAARAGHVRWLYFSWPEAELRPQFAYLLDTSSAVPGLTPRVVATNHPAVLYEIGPGFGREPAWAGDPWLTQVHHARAHAAIDLRDWRSRVIVATEEQRRGHWAEALVMLDEARAYAPDDPDVLLATADGDVHLGRYADAGTLYSRVERIRPGDPRTRLGAGWAAAMAGQAAEAAAIWRPMVTATDDPATLRKMQEVFGATGDAGAVTEVREHERALGIPGAEDRR